MKQLPSDSNELPNILVNLPVDYDFLSLPDYDEFEYNGDLTDVDNEKYDALVEEILGDIETYELSE